MKKVKTEEITIIGLPAKKLLVDRLAYAVDFAKRAVQHLIIEEHGAPKDAPWYVMPEKIIAEIAFLMVFANKAGKAHIPIEKALTTIAEVLKPLARSRAMLLNICLKPALALDYAHAHICLHYLGYPNEKFDAALRDALESEAADGIERMPYRQLEREWLRGIWNNHFDKASFQFWIPISCLNHKVDLFIESADSVYSLTHAIMYTAFGGKKIPNVDTDELLQRVEALLVRYMDEQDYDIAGELLMAWPLLKKPMSPIAMFALNCLLYIENKVGFLPAPGLDLTMIEGKEQLARRTYIYSINYHTVLVMGLLCSSLLENWDNIKIQIDKPTYSANLKNWLVNKLHKGKQPHWKEYFSKLSQDEKQPLIPWILQAILARYVKEKKYGQVKKMLELSIGSDLETLAMCKQARALLNRLKRNVQLADEEKDLEMEYSEDDKFRKD